MLKPDEIYRSADKTLEVMETLEVAMRAKAAEALASLSTARRAEVERALSVLAGKAKPALSKSVDAAFIAGATTALSRDEQVYRAARVAGLIGPYAELADSAVLNRVLTTGIATARDAMNLVASSAQQAVYREFTDALDTAMLRVVSGAAAPDAAIAEAVKRIAESTSRITYVNQAGDVVESTIYSAVRRNVVTGMHQTTLRMQSERMKELGARYVEITAHSGARPSHAEWQGQVIPFADLESVTGYGDVDGLGGANCGHSYFPYFPEIMEPTDWSWAQDDDGEDYELSQRQRTCERNVRTYQRRADIYKAGGQDAEAKRNEQMAGKWRAEARSVAKERKGAVRLDRERAYPGEERFKR